MSQIYKMLTDRVGQERPLHIAIWEKEIGIDLNEHEQNVVLRAAHHSAIDVNTIETNYKCLSRWYITPEKIKKYQPGESNLCWRGCGIKGTVFHIWWECPKICEYWLNVRQLVMEITGISLTENPWDCIFHKMNKPWKQYKNTLVPNLLNAAKGAIPRKWLSTESPTLRDWCNRAEYIYNMEYLSSTENEQVDQFGNKWEKWVDFKSTNKYVKIWTGQRIVRNESRKRRIVLKNGERKQ